MDRMLTRDVMLMIDLNESIDQLTKTNSVHWYGHVLRNDRNNFLRRTLDFNVKGTRKSGKAKKILLRAVVEQSRKFGLSGSNANSH